MTRYAIINTLTGKVDNVVEYATAPSNPPPGFDAAHIAVPSPIASPGDGWDGTKVIPSLPPPPPAPPPTPSQLFTAALAPGCAIVSTASPVLNGTYPIDAAQQQIISGIAAGIAARNRLPGGGATFNYPDLTGTLHAFTAANFLNFASAIEDFVYALKNGQAPAQPVTIP